MWLPDWHQSYEAAKDEGLTGICGPSGFHSPIYYLNNRKSEAREYGQFC